MRNKPGDLIQEKQVKCRSILQKQRNLFSIGDDLLQRSVLASQKTNSEKKQDLSGQAQPLAACEKRGLGWGWGGSPAVTAFAGKRQPTERHAALFCLCWRDRAYRTRKCLKQDRPNSHSVSGAKRITHKNMKKNKAREPPTPFKNRKNCPHTFSMRKTYFKDASCIFFF